MTVIETIQRVTPLGVALHDLLTDSPITDGLIVSARPSASTGRFRPAAMTPRGVHLISGVPGLRHLEFPRPQPGQRVDVDADLAAGGLTSGATVDVDVMVVDRLRRFVPTVMQFAAPRRGIATALDALAGCAALAWSVPDDTPMFLMSSPERTVATTTASVRACLRDRLTLQPAAHAVLVVDTPAGRNLGVADAAGNVLVAFAYPAFAGTAIASPPAGSAGVVTTDQHWAVDISVRWSPTDLSFPAGVEIPRVHSVFCQRPANVFGVDGGPPASSIAADLRYASALVVSSAPAAAGDPSRESFLLVEPAP